MRISIEGGHRCVHRMEHTTLLLAIRAGGTTRRLTIPYFPHPKSENPHSASFYPSTVLLCPRIFLPAVPREVVIFW